MTGKASSSRAHSQRATQHIRLPCLHDAYEHSFILTMPSSLAPLRLYAGRYAVASRFGRQPCGCGIHCSRASDGLLPLRLYLVGYVRWDARSNPVHLLLDNRYQQLQLYSSQRSVDSEEAGPEDPAPKSSTVPMPTPLLWRTAVPGGDRYREGGLGSAVSLAQGKLHRDGPGTEESSPSPPTPGGSPLAMGRAVRATKGRPEEAWTDAGAVLRPHITEEGGEPQGSREGRPRHPLEGRGKQSYEPVERRHNEAQNSRTYAPRHRQNS